MDTDTATIVTTADQPAVRVMALHALLYCERLFYLEEVEEIRVADASVFAGRQLHESLAATEQGDWHTLELASTALGIKGKVDCLRRRDGSYIPYEHKRGRPHRLDDNTPAAWQSDRIQIIAYALLLEEAVGQAIPEGRIHYHAANVTVRVPIDQKARDDLNQAIDRARQLRDTVERPPIAENERLCQRCSLAPVCLPEEVRQAQGKDEAVRLFPADRNGSSLHVVTQGAYVGRAGDCIEIRPRDEPATRRSIREIDSLILHGFAQVSTQALRMCTSHNVQVHWLTTSGHHMGSLVNTAGQVQRRIRQYRALVDSDTCLRLAKALTLAKVAGQHAYLMRASRQQPDIRKRIIPNLHLMREEMRTLAHAGSADALRGHEGTAAVRYFDGLRQLLSDKIPNELRTDNRNRRPPLDRFNALLSYGYGLLHTAVMRAVLSSGLEPALGFYHTPRSAAYPLVLDLMELFRVPMWDVVMVGSLNRGQWDPHADFTVTKAQVWLSELGRKKAISLFEARLQEQWKHPVVRYSLSYFRTIELEARLLEKEWTGEPGLFARSRLR